MFTGIIEDIGTVRSFKKTGDCGKMTITTNLPLETIGTGDSIAIDGVCLTVVNIDGKDCSFDVAEETLNVTTLGTLSVGSHVNLEMALTMGKALGGHMVTGHVDTPGTIKSVKNLTGNDGDYVEIEVTVPEKFFPHLVRKGSVAVDGISLTVADLTSDGFRIAIIPHTLEKTTLDEKKAGSPVNIETDIIGKYIERFLTLGKVDRNITDSILGKDKE